MDFHLETETPASQTAQDIFEAVAGKPMGDTFSMEAVRILDGAISDGRWPSTSKVDFARNLDLQPNIPQSSLLRERGDPFGQSGSLRDAR